MVVTGTSKMSRADEVHRITENVYKSIMEQFNPCLRNFVAMGKTYEKALSRDVLFQMAEVHRQIQMQLEDMLKSFHNELLTELEKKVELDARYLNAALKKYQMEHRSKGESLEKCQAELKKLRRKSQQGSKTASKYGDSEMQGKDLLMQKIPMWQQACADPHKLPDRAVLLTQQMGAAGALGTGPHHAKSSLVISDPMPGAKPLPLSPELAALMGSQQRMMGMESVSMVNGTAGTHGGEDYQRWIDSQAAQSKASQQVHRHGSETYSNTLPVRKVAPTKSRSTLAETQTLPRSSSVAAGLERNGRTRVQAIFSHSAGDNNTLLSFTEGDIITLLVPEARDGWHYGESEKTRMRGWFPFSYTRVIPETDGSRLGVSLQHGGRSCSTGNLLDREPVLPTPDYGSTTRLTDASLGRQRPYSMAGHVFSQQRPDDYEVRYPTRHKSSKGSSTGSCQCFIFLH
ncbi:brain-specific angiogenesis inhibitor 1-associated protein 2 isoform X4 [Trichomycterus rosablanca]|uniref:brain-specific angiogenesis inhibitor 1-associated protein 2 isoform X4 n=1 Tax=Trichomycterus rosablanca TaxID=2290929 RepID=UPI002F3584EC